MAGGQQIAVQHGAAAKTIRNAASLSTSVCYCPRRSYIGFCHRRKDGPSSGDYTRRTQAPRTVPVGRNGKKTLPRSELAAFVFHGIEDRIEAIFGDTIERLNRNRKVSALQRSCGRAPPGERQLRGSLRALRASLRALCGSQAEGGGPPCGIGRDLADKSPSPTTQHSIGVVTGARSARFPGMPSGLALCCFPCAQTCDRRG